MPRTAPTAKSKEVGSRLRALRKQHGGTQAEIAEAIGIERATLTGIETGAAHPGRETMANLAQFYSVTLDYLNGGSPLSGDDIALDPAQQEKQAIFLRLLWRMREDQREVVATVMRGLLNEPATIDRLHATPSRNTKGT